MKPLPNATDYALLVLLALMFGSSFLFTSVSVAQLPPITVAASRLLIAFLLLLPVALIYRDFHAARLEDWGWLVLAAVLGNALPFSLISWGQVKVDAGLTSIFMAVMPLVTIVLAHWLTDDEKLGRNKLIGVLLGLAGVIVLFGADALHGIGEQSIRQLAILGSTVCYALNAIITKRLVHLPRMFTITALMFVSALLLVPVSLLAEQPWQYTPDAHVIISLLLLAAGPTAIATLMILVIINRQGASFLSQINFMVPVFGVLLAAIFLHERLPGNGYIALVLIIGGIALSRYGSAKPVAATSRPE